MVSQFNNILTIFMKHNVKNEFHYFLKMVILMTVVTVKRRYRPHNFHLMYMKKKMRKVNYSCNF